MRALAGKTVALLRAQGQGGELKSGLEALGASVLVARLRHGIAHRHGHDHHHHDHAPANIGWRSLAAVGISGGLLPCPSALVVLLAAISLHRLPARLFEIRDERLAFP